MCSGVCVWCICFGVCGLLRMGKRMEGDRGTGREEEAGGKKRRKEGGGQRILILLIIVFMASGQLFS